MSNLPNFLIIGAQKCGTTTLYDILKLHPEIYMSPQKEVNFFTSPEKMQLGNQKYSSYFPDVQAHHKAIGEASPGYICYPGAAKLIKDSIGPVKLILILRDPIKRGLSQYWDNRRHLKESLSFNQALNVYLSDNYNPNSIGYFSRGVYIRYIEYFWEHFSKENLHIMLLENLIKQPAEELSMLYEFLGVNFDESHLKLSVSSNTSLIWKNALYNFMLNNPGLTNYIPKHGRRIFFFGKQVPYKYPMPQGAVLERLKNFYKPWNDELQTKTGLDLSSWL